MQNLLGPAKLEGLLTTSSEGLAQHDLEPASPFTNMSAVSNFWKGKTQALSHDRGNSCWTLLPASTFRVHAEFELDSFRQKMDEQGMAVAENQESSLKSRRKLAETTRGMPPEVQGIVVQLQCHTLRSVCLQNSRRVLHQN